MEIKKLDEFGLNFIATEEGGFMLKPYICPAGIPTISAGVTFYGDGKKVTMKDPEITLGRAKALFLNTVKPFEKAVWSLTRDDISQNQFNALVSFCYNVGVAGLKSSTLLKRVNANPNDPKIEAAFKSWVYGGDGTKNKVDDDRDGLVDEAGEKKRLKGLENRRNRESIVYFKK